MLSAERNNYCRICISRLYWECIFLLLILVYTLQPQFRLLDTLNWSKKYLQCVVYPYLCMEWVRYLLANNMHQGGSYPCNTCICYLEGNSVPRVGGKCQIICFWGYKKRKSIKNKTKTTETVILIIVMFLFQDNWQSTENKLPKIMETSKEVDKKRLLTQFSTKDIRNQNK